MEVKRLIQQDKIYIHEGELFKIGAPDQGPLKAEYREWQTQKI